jgi:hypothetical protein
MQKSILFLGDSYTWGEGLELYCDTPKWIAEREVDNMWITLMHKQDVDGVRFREENRYPTLVAKHFNKIALVSKTNGGCLAGNIRVGQEFLFNPDYNIDTIIIQFSAFTREPLHSSFTCLCDFCIKTEYFRPYEAIYGIINSLLNKKKLDFNQEKTLSMFENLIGLKFTDTKFLDRVLEEKYNWYENLIQNFYLNHIMHWQSGNKRKFYFIDSWERDSSIALSRQPSTLNSMNQIPLIGKDNCMHFRWEDWENTFTYKKIQDEFKNCCNGHPTLEQHQYLAKSIIKYLEYMENEIV